VGALVHLFYKYNKQLKRQNIRVGKELKKAAIATKKELHDGKKQLGQKCLSV